MSSSSKFPSGLNNWAGSDKPVRTDFNNDNEIIDSNAMWKDTYDPKANPVDLAGPVETAGGIPAYALARADYDPNGNVANLGGIEAAIAAKGDAISVYTHTKSGTAHELTLAGGGNNIKFIATDDFDAGDTLSVNSTPVTVYDSDGQLLGIPFRFGDVVLMLRNDDAVRVLAPLLTKPTVYPATAAVQSGTLMVTSSASAMATDYDLRFSVPQGYTAGMPVSIDGTAVTIVSLDGMEIDIDAVENAPISLFRKGNLAYWA